MFLHLLCGALISTSASQLEYIGPYPIPICNITPVQFQADCYLPQSDNYKQTMNFVCFGVLFASIASASATFGEEQVNYWRECAAGLNSIPYFFGKWLVNFPRIVGAAGFFLISFSIRFQDTSKRGDTFAIILTLYWFGFAIGYVVSQCVPIRYASSLGVLIALIFAVGLSGVNPSLKDVNSYSQSRQIPWSVSGPRWALEAFYVSQVSYYETIPY